MASAARNSMALEVLRKLNAAITLKRLYPSSAPQIIATVEDSFDAISLYLKRHGTLSFSLHDHPTLCGVPISQKTLGKIEGYDLFQRLEVLELPHLVLEPGLRKETYKQILSTLSTSPMRISKEGGLQQFLAGLQLTKIFPQKYRVDVVPPPSNQFNQYLADHSPAKSIKDVQESPQTLLHNRDSETFEAVLQAASSIQEKSQLILLLIAQSLKDMEESGEISEASHLVNLLYRVVDHIPETEVESLQQQLSSTLLEQFTGIALLCFLSQEYQEGFGLNLFSVIMVQITMDSFSEAMNLLRRQERGITTKYGRTSSNAIFTQEAKGRLLQSRKGKQFLGQEKANKLLKIGETERKNKRIQAGLSALLKNNLSVLAYNEIVEYLPHSIEMLIQNGKDDVAANLIEILAKELIRDGGESEGLSLCLGNIGEVLVKNDKWSWLENLCVPFMAWAKSNKRGDVACEKIFRTLHRIMYRLWREEKFIRPDQILTLFHSIRTGILEKSEEIKKVVEKIEEEPVDVGLLKTLLQTVLGDSTDDVQRSRLSKQGVVVARFLIITLVESNQVHDRRVLLELLSGMGGVLPPLLIEYLQNPMPWYGKRNLIKLLADTGGEEHVSIIIQFMHHEDLRVQREAFFCLYKISGNNRKKVLLEMLAVAGEQMKVQAVKALLPYPDDDVAVEMLELLNIQVNFSSNVRSSLVKSVAQLLGHCSPEIALEPLRKFHSMKGKGDASKFDEAVWESVEDALSQLRVGQRLSMASGNGHLQGMVDVIATDEAGEPREALSITDFPEENEIRYLFEKGMRKKALLFLESLIAKTARLKQFNKAENLRDWYINEDPGALSQIILAAEIIENEKRKGIDKNHLAVWNQLHEILTTEEFHALYYSLEHRSYKSNESIVQQGDMQSCLYFINRGKVKLFYKEKNEEMLISTLIPGVVIGTGTFFDASVWTVNVSSINQVEVSVLNFSKIVQWEKDYPALEMKLHDYCSQFKKYYKSLRSFKNNRRTDKRYPLSGRLSAVILSPDGERQQVSMGGELADISRGGVSYLFRISNKSNARLLLGHSLNIRLDTIDPEDADMLLKGTIVAVKSLRTVDNEHSVHIKFKSSLDGKKLKNIIQRNRVKKNYE